MKFRITQIEDYYELQVDEFGLDHWSRVRNRNLESLPTYRFSTIEEAQNMAKDYSHRTSKPKTVVVKEFEC